MTYKLIIFDIDGTLADRETSDLLPGVKDWFDRHGAEQAIALATNQGGVGLRHWMEDGGFGDPTKFPDEPTVRMHITKVVDQLGCTPALYICFAYRSQKSGTWSPTPADKIADPEWQPHNRKPSPGMLLRAMADFHASPEETLMVGNGAEDEQAAAAGGIVFRRAAEFFKE